LVVVVVVVVLLLLLLHGVHSECIPSHGHVGMAHGST